MCQTQEPGLQQQLIVLVEIQEKLYYRFHPKLHLLLSLSNSGAGARAGAVMNQALDRGPQQQLSLACGKHRNGPLQEIVKMTT